VNSEVLNLKFFFIVSSLSGVRVDSYLLEILRHRSRKWSLFPTPPLLMPPLRGNPSEFLDETYPAKTRGMGLLCGENRMILTYNRFWLTHPCDRRTEKRRGDSICALGIMLSRAKMLL